MQSHWLATASGAARRPLTTLRPLIANFSQTSVDATAPALKRSTHQAVGRRGPIAPFRARRVPAKSPALSDALQPSGRGSD